MRLPVEELDAIWSRNPSTLVRAFVALADLYRTRGGFQILEDVADDIDAVLATEYDPRPSARPQLEPPPKLRPASPGTEPGS